MAIPKRLSKAMDLLIMNGEELMKCQKKSLLLMIGDFKKL